jgi:hypothetical protein
MKSEEFAMKEIPKMNSFKSMKLNFYMPSQTPKRVGGEMNKHFTFTSQHTIVRRMMKRKQKQRAKMLISRPLLQTLSGYVEAAKCRTLDQFAEESKA